MKEMINKLRAKSLFRFIIVGGCSTSIDFAIYILLSIKLSVKLAKTISMVIASIFSYLANKRFTFENRDRTNWRYIVKFYMVFSLNMIANVGANSFVLGVSHNKIWAFAFATIIGMTVNYVGQRVLVFRYKSTKSF